MSDNNDSEQIESEVDEGIVGEKSKIPLKKPPSKKLDISKRSVDVEMNTIEIDSPISKEKEVAKKERYDVVTILDSDDDEKKTDKKKERDGKAKKRKRSRYCD